jgi:hypothetical protein
VLYLLLSATKAARKLPEYSAYSVKGMPNYSLTAAMNIKETNLKKAVLNVDWLKGRFIFTFESSDSEYLDTDISQFCHNLETKRPSSILYSLLSNGGYYGLIVQFKSVKEARMFHGYFKIFCKQFIKERNTMNPLITRYQNSHRNGRGDQSKPCPSSTV